MVPDPPLKLPLLTLKLHTTPLFRQKALSSVSAKKYFLKLLPKLFNSFLFFSENTVYLSKLFAMFPSLPKRFELLLLAKMFCTLLLYHLPKCFYVLCKRQDIFFNCFFSSASAVTPEPLHTCTETNCSSEFFLETENRSWHARKEQSPARPQTMQCSLSPSSVPTLHIGCRPSEHYTECTNCPNAVALGRTSRSAGCLRRCHSLTKTAQTVRTTWTKKRPIHNIH